MASKARKSASPTKTAKPTRGKAAAGVTRKLTPKQERFVEEYLVDLNATKAAIRAGYSPKTAEQQGYQLLQIPSVQAAIAAKREQVSAATGITIERVLKEAERLAFFDPRKLFHEDGTPKKITELDDDTAAAIQGLDVATIGNSEVGVGQVLKYKIADRNSALERLFKHLGLFDKDNRQRNPADAITGFLAELSARGSRLPASGSGAKA